MARKAPRRKRKKRESGVIWSKGKARKTAGEVNKNSWAMTFNVKRDLAYDIDVRPLVEHVSVGMAKFFRDHMRAGTRPTGGTQRRVNARTKSLSESRITDKMGGRSGFMADHWWLGKIRGDAIKSMRYVKPYAGDDGPEPSLPGPGRDVLLNVLLKKGVDFQSVRGQARVEIQRLFDEWLATCIGENPGNPTPDGNETLLPDAKDGVEK